MVLLDLIAVLVVLAVAWVVTKFWVPGGSLVPTFRWHAYRVGMSRPFGPAAVALSAAGIGGAIVLHGGSIEDIGVPFAIPAGVYLAGVLLGAVAASNWPRYRRLRAAEERDALRAADGNVIVDGEVGTVDDPLSTPFTDTAAVCYIYVVAEYKRGYRSSAWFTTAFGTGSEPFPVRDDTGEVLVDPAEGWLSLAPANSPTTTRISARSALTGGVAEKEVVVDEGDPLPEQVRRFYADRDGDPPETAERDTRFKELVLEPGDDVVVLGRATRTPSNRYPDTPVIGADGDAPLVAAGSLEEVRDGLRQTVVRNGAISVGAILLGAAGMLVAGGVI